MVVTNFPLLSPLKNTTTNRLIQLEINLSSLLSIDLNGKWLGNVSKQYLLPLLHLSHTSNIKHKLPSFTFIK